ncbi:unnamed protein product [Haemonchus placei]|uniref:Secreted protein n=1 Tax=Haemonchus placei TaxID=6290 RepID=A0A3P7VYQ1_HAEPC|nr:unnamed protein product [Haemonchus placei]
MLSVNSWILSLFVLCCACSFRNSWRQNQVQLSNNGQQTAITIDNDVFGAKDQKEYCGRSQWGSGIGKLSEAHGVALCPLGKLFGPVNFRPHGQATPFRELTGLGSPRNGQVRADSVRCSSTIIILRRPATTPFFDALARTFDFLVAGPSSQAAILRRPSTFDSSWTSHHWTSIFFWNHLIRSTTTDVLLSGGWTVATFILSKRRSWKDETPGREWCVPVRVSQYQDEDGRRTICS